METKIFQFLRVVITYSSYPSSCVPQAFPKGSPLAIDFSQAILEATESGEVQRLENDMLSSFNCSLQLGFDGSIGPEPFFVLFTAVAAISVVAALILLLVSLTGKRSDEAMVMNNKFWRWLVCFTSGKA